MATDDRSSELKIVELGIDAEAFKQSRLYKAMAQRCQEIAEDAVEQLKGVDPHDTKQIILLQVTIWKAESFTAFLDEMILHGWQAEQQLTEPT